MNPVEAHYDCHAEREWERLERHRTEFAVTCRILADNLPSPPARILDIGGGPGRYAIHLIQQGYDVTLLDLSSNCLDLATEKATELGVYLPAPIKGDARNLPNEYTGVFDAALLLGPLYHLISAEDRTQAIQEARRILRPDGILFAGFITRFAPLRDIAMHSPQWILDFPDRYHQILNEGINPAHPTSTFPDSFFIHPDDVISLMEDGGFISLSLQGCESIVAGHEETVNALTGELWQAWVALNYRLGKDPSLFGAADHLLYVGRKPNLTA
jgi:S-adenosylmethionine-dependent methyltransferase